MIDFRENYNEYKANIVKRLDAVFNHNAVKPENARQKEEEEENRWLQVLSAFDDAIPFQSGMKWGLKVGGRITVPPIYRNVRPPVGKYRAVEKRYSQWGIITLDDRVLIEPQYPEVTIAADDTVVLTSVTRKKMSVRLK